MPQSYVTYPIDATSTVLVDKRAPGIETHALSTPDAGGTASEFFIEAIARLTTAGREVLAKIVMDVRVTKKIVNAIIGDLVRKVVLPLPAVHAPMLSEILTKITSEYGHFTSPELLQALHGIYYVPLRRMGLVSEHDTLAQVLVPHRAVLPTAARIQIDLVKFKLRKGLELPEIFNDKAITGTMIFERLHKFLTHLSLQIRHAPYLPEQYYIVLGSINRFLTNRSVSQYRETKEPFPALVRVLTLAQAALDPTLEGDRIDLEPTRDHEWTEAVTNVHEWLGHDSSDFALRSIDEVASYFQVNRVYRDTDRRFSFIHMGRALDPAPTYLATAVHALDLGSKDTKLLIKNEKVSERVAAWQTACIPLASSDRWTALATNIVGRGDIERQVTVRTLSYDEYRFLTLANTMGFRAMANDDGSRVTLELQFIREEKVDRRHLMALSGRAVTGDVIATVAFEDVLEFGQLLRPSAPGKYPSGAQEPKSWLSSALTHMHGLRHLSLGKKEHLQVTTHDTTRGGLGRTVSGSGSAEQIFDIVRFARDIIVLENPVSTGAFDAGLVQGIGVAFACWGHKYAQQQLGLSVAHMFLETAAHADVERGAHLILRILRIPLRPLTDYDAIRTWASALLASATLMYRFTAQANPRILDALRQVSNFPAHVDDAIMARGLFSGT